MHVCEPYTQIMITIVMMTNVMMTALMIALSGVSSVTLFRPQGITRGARSELSVTRGLFLSARARAWLLRSPTEYPGSGFLVLVFVFASKFELPFPWVFGSSLSSLPWSWQTAWGRLTYDKLV